MKNKECLGGGEERKQNASFKIALKQLQFRSGFRLEYIISR